MSEHGKFYKYQTLHAAQRHNDAHVRRYVKVRNELDILRKEFRSFVLSLAMATKEDEEE